MLLLKKWDLWLVVPSYYFLGLQTSSRISGLACRSLKKALQTLLRRKYRRKKTKNKRQQTQQKQQR